VGESKAWKERFFDAHPFCCFCGGKRPATTLDHQPGRLFFRRREWPENFVFPACAQCNDISRRAEKALGILIHGDGDTDDRGQFRSNLASFKSEFPGEIEKLLFSTTEKRSLFRELNLNKPDGISFAEIPLMRMNVDFWQPHFEMFARKLLLAMHYQCFQRAIPSEGGTYSAMFTNFDDMMGEFPSDLTDSAVHYVGPVRNGRRLDEQFCVRFNTVSDSDDAGVFLLQFHKRLIFSGVTTARRGSLSLEAELLPPFLW
jgi:hypothetical protein